MNRITRSVAQMAATLSLFGASPALAQEWTNADSGSFVLPGGVGDTSSVVDPHDLTRPNDDSQFNPADLGTVLTVDVSFRDGKWSQRAEPQVIYCRPPRNEANPVAGAEIRLVDDRGEVVGRRGLDAPRLVLREDPRNEPEPLHALDMSLQIALVGQPARVEFYEDMRKQDVPSLAIDLTRALDEFRLIGGLRVPNCENADPPFTRLANQPFRVLTYALERVAQVTDLSTEEVADLLDQYGKEIGSQVTMPRTVHHLLMNSTYEY